MAQNSNRLNRFWQELKRRKVFGVIGTYTATAYIIIEVVNNLVQSLNLPPWIGPIVVLLLVIGLPVAVIISWIFDFTPQGIRKTESLEESEKTGIEPRPVQKKLRLSYILNAALIIAVIILAWPRIFKRDSVKRLASSGEKIAITVMPFQNMTNDTTLDIWQDGIQNELVAFLTSAKELKVRQTERINSLIQSKGITDYASVTPSVASTISRRLESNVFVFGTIKQAGTKLRLNAQLIDSKTNEPFKSFEINGPVNEGVNFQIIDSLKQMVNDFLLISKLISENPESWRTSSTNSLEAFKDFIFGNKAMIKFDLPNAIQWYEKAVAVDSNFIDAMVELAYAYKMSGKINMALPLLNNLYGKRDQMSQVVRLRTDFFHADYFEPIDIRINLLKQLQEIDDQGNYHRVLAEKYTALKQTDKAILEYEKSLEIWRRWGKAFLKGNPAYAALGEAYHRTGQYKKARKIYREAERVNDNHITPYFSWIIRDQAALALTEGDTDKAAKYIEKLIIVLKENSFSEAGINAELHKMYRQAGNLDKAEEYLRKALSSEPDSPQRLNSFAAFLIVNDRKVEEALELIDKALELSPDNGDYLDTKGMGLYKLRKYNEALELLEKARDLKKPFYSYDISSHLEEVKKTIKEQN